MGSGRKQTGCTFETEHRRLMEELGIPHCDQCSAPTDAGEHHRDYPHLCETCGDVLQDHEILALIGDDEFTKAIWRAKRLGSFRKGYEKRGKN